MRGPVTRMVFNQCFFSIKNNQITIGIDHRGFIVTIDGKQKKE